MSNLVLLDAAKKLRKNHGFGALELREAIPYIRAFQGTTMVVKIGGSVLDSPKSGSAFFDDVVFMAEIGVRMILVHGGSRQLTDRMNVKGIKPQIVKGVRFTDRATLELAVSVFNDLNAEIVESVKQHGGRAVGCPAGRGGLVRAVRAGSDERNFVGRVADIDIDAFHAFKDGCIPVVTCIGTDGASLYNINADAVSSGIAGALKAEKLILMTDVDGVRDADGTILPTLTRAKVNELIESGVVAKGMVPKVSVCLEALAAGVHKTHIINGAQTDSLLSEVFTDQGVGTEIIADESKAQSSSIRGNVLA